MSSPGVERTAVVDFCVGARLVEQLATSTANAANAISFRGLFIGNARIT
jgi:dienelactone hydrolase